MFCPCCGQNIVGERKCDTVQNFLKQYYIDEINTLSKSILLKYVVRIDYVLCLNSVIQGREQLYSK